MDSGGDPPIATLGVSMRRIFAPLLVLLSGCGQTVPPFTVRITEGFSAKFLGDTPGLHNLIRVNDWLYTGSEPESDPGFESLQSLGIRTIITVDGTTPDLARAGKQCMRYVHIPIGYNAIPQDRVRLIAKAMKELPRPIYLHCHHGKHRGPAAAIAALRCLDPQCSLAESLGFLKLAGTDPEYSELYASVENQRVLPPAELGKVPATFPTSAPVPNFVGKMIELDNLFQRLKNTQAKDRQEAIALRELYRELLRESDHKPEGFRKLLQQGEMLSEELIQTNSNAATNNAIAMSSAICTDCHKKFRNHAPAN